jgi:hypothetical protein
MIGGRIVQLLESIITGGSVKLAAGNNNIGQVGIDPNNNAIQLSGSIVSIEERLWLSTDPDPVPVSNRALGVVVDVATNEMTTKYWNGASWEVVR